MSNIWGQFKGASVIRYTIANKNGMKAVVMNYGANLLELYVRDAEGKMRDVVLGHDELESYFTNPTYFGASVLPCANRIGGAKFTINGVEYPQDMNDGNNSLHSGFNGLSHRMWNTALVSDSQVIFDIEIDSGDCSMPGKRHFTCSYLITDDDCLCIKYSCISDQDTIFNPTNHSYFNLKGHSNGNILDHELTINASGYTHANQEAIPNGDIIDVSDTPFDFRSPKRIGQDIGADNQALIWAKGYDHNYCIDMSDSMSYAATLTSRESGITMDVYSELPGLQIYTGNYISSSDIGKGGKAYGPNAGVALETQFYPNAINIDSFQSPIIEANQLVEYETVFQFDTI